MSDAVHEGRDGGAPLKFSSAAGPLARGGVLRGIGGLLVGTSIALGILAVVIFVLGSFFSPSPPPAFAHQPDANARPAILELVGFLAFFSLPLLFGVKLFHLGGRRVIDLHAGADGLAIRTVGDRVERVPWAALRKVEFRRLEVRFAIERPRGRRAYRVLTIGWGRAEDFVRLKNYFVERMSAAAERSRTAEAKA